MVGVRDVGVVDALQIRLDVARRARRFREAFDDRLAHLMPEQPQPVYVRRGFAGSDDQGRLVREGIVFPHVIAGRRHGFHDIVRDAVAVDVAVRSALDAVRLFYTYITRYQQLGIPSGRAKKALWPLLSKRLAQQLDSLEACNEDYYRRYGEILRANTYKPATAWLEEGLFTGPNDAATPRIFRILGSRAVGENRVDVLIAFKEDWGDSEGDVTAILDNKHWVIDDYVAMYENDDLQRLSAGYSECKGGQWVGETPH
jgi:hypothetical protein